MTPTIAASPVQAAALRRTVRAVTFEETLSALQHLIGRRVTVKVTVGARGAPQVTIAFIEGDLLRTLNRGPAVMPDLDAGVEAWDEHDAHFVVVGHASTGFYLSPQAFHDARWLSDEPGGALWIEHGPDIVVTVVPAV